ncbi:hypothetical protein RclHR1_00620011 [Rhizophagus clarus]|uniref:Kinase-like domain-containing protein n=1 Tax=Rhizophagus clarus TaxID=94130 RepID=A0A2Z6RSX6_9GLOM|nr:hypothetical protein RclHR1_00620011 [Rhizophagus clarus]GES99897.1 kinase-like domain-containing protein [Rhizophagus clarus]
MSHISKNINFFGKGKRRNENEIENPRIEIIPAENEFNDSMAVDYSSPLPSPTPSPTTAYEVSRELKRLRLDNNVEETCMSSLELSITAGFTIIEGASNVAQNFSAFAPLIKQFFDIAKEIVILYEKAEHNREICSFLLQRCNCARVAVEDLDMRKTENVSFFSRKENFDLFKDFIKCMQRIKNFIGDVSQLNRLKKYFFANNIEETFTKLISEFEGYMNSLKFSFIVQSRNELIIIKNEIKQLTELLINIHGVSDTKQSKEEFFKGIGIVTKKNKDFKKQSYDQNEFENSVEEMEPLLEGQFQKTEVTRSKKIEKRTAYHDCSEYCFKEFPNNSSSSLNYFNTQIEIRRQVNILKELKNSNHIIKFFGVAQENSKFYLVTEWMEYGNLHEYYTKYREDINWKTKIRFALDICRGVSYLNDCQILHHDIQSANILVNDDHKVKIANFGLSKKFSEFTRNISHNIENVRYMAPEKLTEDESNNYNNNNNNLQGTNYIKRKKVPYDSKCEIYSVGALLWEIAELKKPHSDIVNKEMLISIRERVRNRYREPLSDDVPEIWKFLVKRCMEHEPKWRLRISEICFNLYELSKTYSEIPKSPAYMSDEDENLIIDQPRNLSASPILSVDEAIREHKSNGNKQLAWESFKYHSETNNEAKYWLGYYYYYAEIPELQQLNKDDRHKFAFDIFRETADKGNPSAQLRYGMHLWNVANYSEAIRYLEMSANSGNSTAMYNIGSAYWNGNYVKKDQAKGAKYLRKAAVQNQPKAIEMCKIYNIELNTNNESFNI